MDVKDFETRKDYAQSLFKEGFNCSQSVFTAYADLFGMDKNMALKVSASFGGGIGRMRSVCGCASGIFMVVGLYNGNTNGPDQDAKGRNYKLVQHLAQIYKERAGGSFICSDLLGLTHIEMNKDEKSRENIVSKEDKNTITDAKPSERTKEYYKKRPCLELIGIACDIIEEEILNKI